jgi:hypothetical protein
MARSLAMQSNETRHKTTGKTSETNKTNKTKGEKT